MQVYIISYTGGCVYGAEVDIYFALIATNRKGFQSLVLVQENQQVILDKLSGRDRTI